MGGYVSGDKADRHRARHASQREEQHRAADGKNGADRRALVRDFADDIRGVGGEFQVEPHLRHGKPQDERGQNPIHGSEPL